jgi:hypothetical protein
MNNEQKNQGKMNIENNSVINQALKHFTEAKSVVLVDDVRALNKIQNLQTAAAYSFMPTGKDVVNKCLESFVNSGYGTSNDFYAMLCDLRDSKNV